LTGPAVVDGVALALELEPPVVTVCVTVAVVEPQPAVARSATTASFRTRER
jgi:hypothetical protein